MGQFLQMSVAHTLQVSKKESGWNKVYSKEEILESMKDYFDLELYDAKEHDSYIELTLKRNILEENLKDFLLEQRALFEAEEIRNEVMEALESKNLDKIFELTAKRRYFEIQDCSGISYFGSDLRGVKIGYRGFLYFIEGKAYMECYYSLFSYMLNMLKLSSKNPLKGAVMPDLQ